MHDELGQSLEAIGVCAAYLLRHGPSEPEHPQRQCVRDIQKKPSAFIAISAPCSANCARMAWTACRWPRRWKSSPGNGRRAARKCNWTPTGKAMPPLPASSRHAAAIPRRAGCLTNIARHSQATAVQLRAEVTDGRLCVSVSDNGVARVVQSMVYCCWGCARLESVGGGVTLALNPGGGLCVSLHAPLVGLS